MSEPMLDLLMPDTREGDSSTVHVLMPNMAYACGGNILSKAGHFTCGAADWDFVTCPGCRAVGRDAVSVEVGRQQGRQS